MSHHTAVIRKSVWRDLRMGRYTVKIRWRIDAHSPQGRKLWSNPLLRQSDVIFRKTKFLYSSRKIQKQPKNGSHTPSVGKCSEFSLLALVQSSRSDSCALREAPATQ